MRKFRFKKILPLVSSFSFGVLVTAPIVLASCSSEISSTLLDNLVSKGNGLNLTNNLNLNDLVKYSLTTATGSEKWLNQLTNQSIYQWYFKLANSNNLSNNKDGYSRLFETQKTKIDDDYKNTYDSSKESEGNDFLLKFQQNELDVHGGNEDSWKKEKWLEWASSSFKTDLFANFYLSLVDKNGNFVSATEINLQNALSDDSSGISFKFTKNAINSSQVDDYVANEFANFQQFIFDQWVQSENPFVVSYSQWNYSAPTNGLDSVYNANAIGKDPVNTTVDANYRFPYFNSSKTNDSYSDVEKFNRFTKEKKGFFDNGTKSEELGLINLNKYGYSSDNSSYKLINNVNPYINNSSNFSLASTFLFSTSFSDSKKINNEVRKKISKKLIDTTNTSLPFDDIISNFVATNISSFENGNLSEGGDTSSSTTGSSSEKTYVPYTQILDSQVKEILSLSAYSQLASSNSTSSNDAKQSTNNKYDSSKGLYLIDSFIALDQADLYNTIFLRDNDGVVAIALDGEKYISKASNLFDAKKRAGNVVLYRYLQNKSNSNAGFSIDLPQTLTNFFETNRDWLITKYVQLEKNQSLFDFSFLNGSGNVLTILQDLANNLYITNRHKRIQDYQSNLVEAKNKYDTSDNTALASNYGPRLLFNGLAARYPYPFTAATSPTTSEPKSSGSIAYFTQLDSLKLENPFGDNDQSVKDIDFNDPYGEKGIYKKLNTDIATYIANNSFSALTSNFEGFKYSQYIYTNDFFVNQAILAVGNDGNLLSDLIKKNVLLQNGLKDKFNLSTYDYLIPELYDVNKYDFNGKDASSYINSALSNYFFNSSFQNSSNKWVGLKQTQTFNFGTTTDSANETSETLPTISYDVLNKYRKEMWINENLKMNAIPADNYVNFLTLLSTIDYLMANDGQVFLSQLSSKLSTADSRLSFLVWETSIDTQNQKNTDNKKPNEILYQSSGVYSNVNNSQGSPYYPLNSSTSVVDTNGSAFVNDSYLSSYYTHVSDMVNFLGIQTNAYSQNITETLKNDLFVNNADQKGLLYGFSDSREKLADMVNSFTSSQVLSLANNIQKLFNIDISSVANANNLTQMQQSLITIIKDTNKIKDDAFKPKQGYVKQDLYTEVSNSISGYKYTSYVIQLSENNLSSANGFLEYLKTAFTSNDPNQTSTSTTNTNSEKQANDLFWNLVVQIATDTSVQTNAISNITSTNKITVYDIRLNNQLGSRWILNYKDQSS